MPLPELPISTYITLTLLIANWLERRRIVLCFCCLYKYAHGSRFTTLHHPQRIKQVSTTTTHPFICITRSSSNHLISCANHPPCAATWSLFKVKEDEMMRWDRQGDRPKVAACRPNCYCAGHGMCVTASSSTRAVFRGHETDHPAAVEMSKKLVSTCWMLHKYSWQPGGQTANQPERWRNPQKILAKNWPAICSAPLHSFPTNVIGNPVNDSTPTVTAFILLLAVLVLLLFIEIIPKLSSLVCRSAWQWSWAGGRDGKATDLGEDKEYSRRCLKYILVLLPPSSEPQSIIFCESFPRIFICICHVKSFRGLPPSMFLLCRLVFFFFFWFNLKYSAVLSFFTTTRTRRPGRLLDGCLSLW